MPTVSVIIPAYNRVETIQRAIESVLTQEFEDFELLVVDDGSSDWTAKVVANFQDSRITCIRHPTNKGASAARNTGINHATGEYIAFLDSDDEWDPDKLRKQVREMQNANPEVGVVYTGYRVKYQGATELGQVPTKNGDIYEAQLAKDWVSPTSAVLVKRKCFESVGTFDTTLSARQDYEMWLRLAREYEFQYLKEPLVTIHSDSSNRITGDVRARIEAHQTLLNRLRDDINNLPLHKRRYTLSTQYFTMGRYLQRHANSRKTVRFFINSLRWNPVNLKSWVALVLLLLNVEPDEGYLLRVKNLIKELKINS